MQAAEKFFYIGRRYNIDYLWFMLSPLRWFILVPIRTPPHRVSATSTSFSLFLPLSLSLFHFCFSFRILATVLVPLRFFRAFIPSLSIVPSFFLAYSHTHTHACSGARAYMHAYKIYAFARIIPLLALFLRVTTQWRCHTLSPIESNQCYCFIIPLLLLLPSKTSITYRLAIFRDFVIRSVRSHQGNNRRAAWFL